MFDFFDFDEQAINGSIVETAGSVIADIDTYLTMSDFTERQRKQLHKQRDHLAMVYQKYNGVSYDASEKKEQRGVS